MNIGMSIKRGTKCSPRDVQKSERGYTMYSFYKNWLILMEKYGLYRYNKDAASLDDMFRRIQNVPKQLEKEGSECN